ncbi:MULTISPECIES: CBS domain-containing protein [unclassified Halorhabdus]|uniref:CBS domain-containing protein n=1 Tax=unclassified Halorhabdus TaxID=2621901 RepID=UPI0023DCB3D8|nr:MULTISPECIES: CBS domain-containing protein [unclassified Halorhabdus]WEL16321.1 CBS domain [Halorhabdus sp. SVX81]WEL20212.1 CBS domain [Halorhabdus sp. BNX81]
MNVADVMTPRADVVTAELPGTRDDVLEYLQERQFSSVPVIKRTDAGEECRGLVTREALIEHPDEDQLAMLVDDVPTTAADTDLASVARTMVETGERRIPVVDGQLEGIVTITDIVRAIAEGGVDDGDQPVGDLARRDVNCVYAGAPLGVAERELSHADVPYGVVLDDDAEVAGILTEVDVIAVAEVVEGEAETGESIANQDDEWMWEGIKAVGNSYMPTRNVEFPDEPVSEYMTADLVTVGSRRTAKEAAQLLIRHDIEQIPLVSGDDLAGIVRDIDVIKALR